MSLLLNHWLHILRHDLADSQKRCTTNKDLGFACTIVYLDRDPHVGEMCCVATSYRWCIPEKGGNQSKGKA